MCAGNRLATFSLYTGNRRRGGVGGVMKLKEWGNVQGLPADGGTIVSERCNACIEALTENKWDSC